MRIRIFLLALFLTLAAHGARAGRLDQFEKSATGHAPTQTKSSPSPDNDSGEEDDCSGFFSCVLQAVLFHHDQHADEPDTDASDAASGDSGSSNRQPDPMGFRLAYQSVPVGVYGFDLDGFMQLGIFDVDARITQYTEIAPPDILSINQLNLVLPLRLVPTVTAGPGVGMYELQGNNTTVGPSVSFPLVVGGHHDAWQFALIPLVANINGNLITDIDARIGYRRKGWTLFAGYRDIRTDTQSLGGPYLGFGHEVP